MDRNIIMDNRKNNGGSRPGAGAKKKDPQEVKVTVSVQIKRKHLELGIQDRQGNSPRSD
jgi:hypothetical protein